MPSSNDLEKQSADPAIPEVERDKGKEVLDMSSIKSCDEPGGDIFLIEDLSVDGNNENGMLKVLHAYRQEMFL